MKSYYRKFTIFYYNSQFIIEKRRNVWWKEIKQKTRKLSWNKRVTLAYLRGARVIGGLGHLSPSVWVGKKKSGVADATPSR